MSFKGVGLGIMSSAIDTARPDLEAYEHASRVEFPMVVKELSELWDPGS